MNPSEGSGVPGQAGQTQPVRICGTRVMKNARFLQRVAPAIMAGEEPPEGFASIVQASILARLHQVAIPAALLTDPAHRAALQRVSFPLVTSSLADPMFNGRVFFVRIQFMVGSQHGAVVALDQADIETARAFLFLAAPRISAYASQYGTNGIDVDLSILDFSVSLPGNTYNDDDLQGWVNAIASQNALPASACVIVLNPLGVINNDAKSSDGIGGYHLHADLPYAFVNVMGSNLTIDDTDQFYALALSHEIAEVTVDPLANLVNPEVCDSCGPNDQNVFIDYFAGNGAYLQTIQAAAWPPTPPPFPYAFFINSIVQPASATAHPAPASACAYPPPAKCDSAVTALLLGPRPVLVPSIAAVLL